MYLTFVWRYFRAKKSAQAINIIAWITTIVIAFATCCQVLVLSVFNGFEDLVQSLYGSFYPDIKVIPASGKTMILNQTQIQSLHQCPEIKAISEIAEEKALLRTERSQVVVTLKGVDSCFQQVSGVPSAMKWGSFITGDLESPKLIVGAGIQDAAQIGLDLSSMNQPPVTIILPKHHSEGGDPLSQMSESNLSPSGIFTLQQDFDNNYSFTNISLMRTLLNLQENECTSLEIRLHTPQQMDKAKKSISLLLGDTYKVQTKYEQNSSLYSTMKMEKWAIFGVLLLILLIAAFNMISSLTMLVIEKKQDIRILLSMGSATSRIRKIFLLEGLFLGWLGTSIGLILAYAICLLQRKFHFIKLQGGSFLIDYFPVKLIWTDLLLVAGGSGLIVLLAAWFPAKKASKQSVLVR